MDDVKCFVNGCEEMIPDGDNECYLCCKQFCDKHAINIKCAMCGVICCDYHAHYCNRGIFIIKGRKVREFIIL